MLYQAESPAGEAVHTPGSRRGTPPPDGAAGSSLGGGPVARQRLAAFWQWLRLLLFQLLTLAVQVGGVWYIKAAKQRPPPGGMEKISNGTILGISCKSAASQLGQEP